MDIEVSATELDKPNAERLTEQIKTCGVELGVLLLEAHRGKAWAALGYRSWSAYVECEFSFSRATSYRLLSAAEEEDMQASEGELSHGETVNASNDEAEESPNAQPENVKPDKVLTGTAKKAKATITDDPPAPPAPTPPAAKNDERLPSLREVASAWFTNLQNTEEGFAVRLTAEEVTAAKWRMDLEFGAWAEEHRIPAPDAKVDPPKRRQGTVTTPADRAKAKLAEAPKPDAPCDHSKDKHTKFGWGTMCACGKRVA